MSGVVNPNQRGPKGDKGDQGTTGTNGTNGTNGNAATVSVGTTTTGAAGTSASVTNSGTTSTAVLQFTIPRGDQGATGPAGLGTVTPSTPTRTLNSNFTPNATKAVFCSYTIKTTVTNPLLIGTSTATVSLLSDTAATPTTVRAQAGAESGVGITVTIALTTSNISTVSYIVPAGHNVRLASATTGTGSVSIVAQTEEVLG